MNTHLHEGVRAELVEVPLSQIVPYEGQPRCFFDTKELEELADSLLSEGQRVPVSVFRNPKIPEQLILIGGERRWRAFGLIHERTGKEPMVRAIIEAVADERNLFRKALIDNLHRSDLIPLDEAAAYHRLHYIDGVAIAEIAKLAGKSTTYVSNYLWLHQLPEPVKVLMDQNRPKAERLGVSTAILIARGTIKDDLRIKLAHEAVSAELNGVEVRALLQDVTGTRQRSTGVRERRPSDDLVMWQTFLTRTEKTAARYRKSNVVGFYTYQRNPVASSQSDMKVLRRAVADLQAILAAMELYGGST